MSWLDKNFKYVRSDKQKEGYLKRRFQQIRAEQKALAEEAERNRVEAETKTVTLKARKA